MEKKYVQKEANNKTQETENNESGKVLKVAQYIGIGILLAIIIFIFVVVCLNMVGLI